MDTRVDDDTSAPDGSRRGGLHGCMLLPPWLSRVLHFYIWFLSESSDESHHEYYYVRVQFSLVADVNFLPLKVRSGQV